MRAIRFAFVLVAISLLWGRSPSHAQSGERIAPLLDGMGDYHHAITTDSEQAQRFFDQGLVLAYGFNHAEAARSFREAARLDPDCAMCYWGEALVLGPNINAAMDSAHVSKAWTALQKALERAPRASEREQAYIRALAKRYAEDPPEDRSVLDAAYADAMREVAVRFPDDLDAQALFGEALMDTTPWDYWKENGQPKEVTEEALAAFESVLARNPDHPGANHLYIHAVEAVHPEKGLPMARRLEDLVPGAGHLVHMPSHIYIRTGRYHEAVLTNERAVAADEGYLTQCRKQGFYPLLYYPHNLHFLWYSAMMGGEREAAIDAANKIRANLSDEMIEAQRLQPVVLFALLRFGRWEAVLDEPKPPAEQLYATAMWHYGRGLALLRTGRTEEAARQAAHLERIAKSEETQDLEVPFFYGASQVGIAHYILQGELAGDRGNVADAVHSLREAVRLQDKLPYMEPPYWYYPVRQSLGAVLLEASRPREAEHVYRADLEHFPANGWSLYGLAESLRAQNKNKQAKAVQRQFTKAWAHADGPLSNSRF